MCTAQEETFAPVITAVGAAYVRPAEVWSRGVIVASYTGIIGTRRRRCGIVCLERVGVVVASYTDIIGTRRRC